LAESLLHVEFAHNNIYLETGRADPLRPLLRPVVLYPAEAEYVADDRKGSQPTAQA
jgi:hypothetical protein